MYGHSYTLNIKILKEIVCIFPHNTLEEYNHLYFYTFNRLHLPFKSNLLRDKAQSDFGEKK